MSKFTKEHYEDIANVLRFRMEPADGPGFYVKGGNDAVQKLAKDFADLFAADDLEGVYCGYCGDRTEETECQDFLNLKRPKHSWVYHSGFNEAQREQFLAACGLVSPAASNAPSRESGCTSL